MNKIRLTVEQVFQKYDGNKSGQLDRKEASEFLNSLYSNADVDLDPSKKDDVFAFFDKNNDGYISKQELIKTLLELKNDD